MRPHSSARTEASAGLIARRHLDLLHQHARAGNADPVRRLGVGAGALALHERRLNKPDSPVNTRPRGRRGRASRGVRPLLDPEAAGGTAEPADVLVRLAVSMRAHKRGGTLLVVPAGAHGWRESIERPIRLRRGSALHGAGRSHERGREGRRVAGLRGARPGGGRRRGPDGRGRRDADQRLLRAAGLRRQDRPARRPFARRAGRGDRAGRGSRCWPAAARRHALFSAAQFAQDRQGAFALVASQDGRFTAFAWSPREAMVHAHCVETLLL